MKLYDIHTFKISFSHLISVDVKSYCLGPLWSIFDIDALMALLSLGCWPDTTPLLLSVPLSIPLPIPLPLPVLLSIYLHLFQMAALL